MKRLIYLSLVFTIILFSCEKTPDASFFCATDEPEVGKEVFFNNNSDNANEYEWDFGDGYTSTARNPVHVYTTTGLYEVKLTAYSRAGLSSEATLTIEVFMPSLLVVEVLEYYDLYPVTNASVYLYPDSISWDNETNLVTEGYTDIDGMVVFSHLDYQRYYVDVWEEHHNNVALRYEDVGWIMTNVLARHKLTWFVAYVDYYETTKGASARDRKYVIKKIERKVIDASQPEVSKEEWMSLYNKSVRLKK